MNNNICQFYVILGNKNFIVPNNNNNAYIDATKTKNVKELSDKILNTYKEKAKLGIKVGNQIIFLIPDEKYKLQTEEIIKKLKVNGIVQVMTSNPIPKKEIPIQKVVQPTPQIPVPNPNQQVKIEQPKQVEKTVKQDINTLKSFPTIEKKEEIKERELTIKEEKKEEQQIKDNVYRGTIDNNIYSTQKNKKSNKVAIIIFIISLIFFLISCILLLLV